MRGIVACLLAGIVGLPVPSGAADPVWATRFSGEFVEAPSVLDWGDIAPGTVIEGLTFMYSTNAASLDALISFYTHEDGCDSSGRVRVSGFMLTGLPGSFDPSNAATWVVTLDLAGAGMEFTLDGDDLDGDHLTDFGYEIAFLDPPPTAYVGQATGVADPNGGYPAPGIEDGWYAPDCVMSPYGGEPFAQLQIGLYGRTVCPNPGQSGRWCYADIAGGDCLVDLADLATLLANYGVTSGATHYMGDISPFGGDGAVDLADLAEMLAEYGDDCN